MTQILMCLCLMQCILLMDLSLQTAHTGGTPLKPTTWGL
jgi:hypothetical protein